MSKYSARCEIKFACQRLPARIDVCFNDFVPQMLWRNRLRYDGNDFYFLAYSKMHIERKFAELKKEGLEIENEQRIINVFETIRTKLIKEMITNETIREDGFKTAVPYEHQYSAIRRLVCHTKYIVADDMGLGKTFEAIAAMNILSKKKMLKKGAIVVCPNSVKYWWKRVLSEQTDLRILVLKGGWKKRLPIWRNFFKYPNNTVLITNYELVYRSDKENGGKDREYIEKRHVSLMALDEAQRIKNRNTKTHKALKAVRKDFCWLLTGTPIENHPGELYNLISFMADGLFSGINEFNAKYAVLEKNHFASQRSGRVVMSVSHYKNLKDLSVFVKPLIVRRLKEHVLDSLPEIAHTFATFDLTKEERAKYEGLLQLVALGRMSFFQIMVKLRVICSGTKTFQSRKMNHLMDLLSTYKNKKFIIFSEFKTAVNKIIAEVKTKLGEECATITGDVKNEDRLQEVDKFMEDSNNIRLIVMTNAGALGLNLQNADFVLNYDIPWNPATWQQRIDRAHRIGSKKPILSINFIAKDTIEERIYSVFIRKKMAATQVIDGTENDIDLQDSFYKQIEKSIIEGLEVES